MRIRSCFSRYARFLLCCVGCSVFTFFINSDMLINKPALWIISSVLFVIIMTVDAWFFGKYFGKRKHIKFGVMYPYLLFVLTTYIGHFAITSARWRYFFLPLGIFQNYGASRLISISLVHAITLLLVFIFTTLGKRDFYKKI